MKKRIFAVLGSLALVLASCSGTAEVKSSKDSSETKSIAKESSSIQVKAIDAPMPEIPAGLEKFYTQELTWEECGAGLDCTTMMVPLNYADPDGATIELKIKRRHADSDKIGSLLANPGGPGGGGQEMAESAEQFFTERITNSFDVIGFDPRGVGESSPIDCVSDAELDVYLATTFPDTLKAENSHVPQRSSLLISVCKILVNLSSMPELRKQPEIWMLSAISSVTRSCTMSDFHTAPHLVECIANYSPTMLVA